MPATYGDYLTMLHDKGARFSINSAMLVVAGIEDQLGTVENISAKFFEPIGLKQILALRSRAESYFVY